MALGLTEALGVLGRRVVLVEADLGGGRAPRAGEAEKGGGLASVLAGRSSFVNEVTDVHFAAGPSIRRSEVEPSTLVCYSVLHSGLRVAEPGALLGRATMKAVLEEAKDRGDLVLVLTAPLDQPSCVLPLARLCDGVILVAHERCVKADQAQEIVALLSTTRARLLGTVLVPAGLSEPGLMGTGLVSSAERESANGNGQSSHPHAAAAPQDF